MQVFQLLGAGYSPREIAEQVQLSRKTIETHCEKIKHKLGFFTAGELKRFARQWAAGNLTVSEPLCAHPKIVSQPGDEGVAGIKNSKP
jgi:hypothetical protein